MLGLDNPIHILFLLVIALLVFGAKRLPEMGKSLGEGLRGFKESVSGETSVTHMTSAAEPTRVDDVIATTLLPIERVAEPRSEHTSVTPAA
jgi:sec-independent protein translocase protein TatA